jgi:two-component system LytT family sensor kinase
MVMKKSIEILAHIFLWVSFAVLVITYSSLFLQAKPDAPFSQHFTYVIFLEVIMGLIFFYTTFLSIPWARKKKRNRVILAGILLFLLLFFAYPATHFGFWQVMSSIIPHIIVIFLALVFRKFSDSLKLESDKQTLLLQNMQSELALLKMQISPHFLFNTLNNIDYLITHDTEKASNSISKLGDILRYMIYDAQAEKIPLSAEIKHIEDYIELIRLRTFGENYLHYHLTGHSGNLTIAPMLFLPLIENAYKYSSAKEGENIINIDIKIDIKNLNFVIKNEYDPSRKEIATATGGMGLTLVRRRLDLIYPGRHTFLITQEENRYRIELVIQLDEY